MAVYFFTNGLCAGLLRPYKHKKMYPVFYEVGSWTTKADRSSIAKSMKVSQPKVNFSINMFVHINNHLPVTVSAA